ncbi:MAG: DEAD/DEAH box helicase [Oligoflexales bacterium]|nr:DEAD/DEAH box helicase [Oligoflexales bacterium]
MEQLAEKQTHEIEKFDMSDNLEPGSTTISFQDFSEICFHEELKGRIDELGWKVLTETQEKVLPPAITGKDVICFADEKTGKTTSYLIAIAHYIVKLRRKLIDVKRLPFSVIVVPSADVGRRVESEARQFFGNLEISIGTFLDEDSLQDEKRAAIKNGIEVVVTTNMVFKSLLNSNDLEFGGFSQIIVEEADAIPFEDIEHIVLKGEKRVQKLIFAKVNNNKIREIMFRTVENCEYICTNAGSLPLDNITQTNIICESVNKFKIMLSLIREKGPFGLAIIFTNTRTVAEWLHYKLVHNDIPAELITSKQPLFKRKALAEKVITGNPGLLIATDDVLKSLHFSNFSYVYNFDLSDKPVNYLHRISLVHSTEGSVGNVVSLVCEDYGQNLVKVQDFLGNRVLLSSKWHNKAYLEVVDKSGNPYEDPEFKGNLLRKSSTLGRTQLSQDSNRDARSGSQRPRRDENQRGKKQFQGKDAGPRKGRENQPKSGKFQKDSKHGRRDFDRKPAVSRKQQIKKAKTKAPTTLFGMVKKLFAVIFRRKKSD